ncbi:MAG: CidA/LrgA family protein [Neisseriaceae bacterium]|nr:CidA/LrgA family protein [Neisseriaceae bacterium]
MRLFFLTIAQYLRAVAILCLFVVAGNYVNRLGVPLPAPIVGMLLLFFSLIIKLIPEHWVAPTCNLLGRYMALLFVPVSVGLMVNYPAVEKALLPLLVACSISSLLVLLTVGGLIQWQENKTQMRPMKKKNAFKKERKNV